MQTCDLWCSCTSSDRNIVSKWRLKNLISVEVRGEKRPRSHVNCGEIILEHSWGIFIIGREASFLFSVRCVSKTPHIVMCFFFYRIYVCIGAMPTIPHLICNFVNCAVFDDFRWKYCRFWCPFGTFSLFFGGVFLHYPKPEYRGAIIDFKCQKWA